MIRRILPIVPLLVLAACGEPSRGPPAGAPAGAGPAAASKSLTVKGSDTMVILAQREAEKFMLANPDATIQVTGGGSGTGLAALINGTTEIATSSRPIKEAERKQVQQKFGAEAVETRVAIDGLAVFVHPSNPLSEISLEQLQKIYTGQLKNWSELGAGEGRIVVYSRENNSGTYAYFKEHVLKDEDFAADVQTLPGTAAVVNAVTKDPKSIGYGGIAFGEGIKELPVKKDAGSPAIAPNLATVTSGAYPISRGLYFYTAGQPAGVAKAFIDFVLSPEGQAIVSTVGYYPLPTSGAAPTDAAPAAPTDAAPAAPAAPAPAAP